jgi:hypothetical protein
MKRDVYRSRQMPQFEFIRRTHVALDFKHIAFRNPAQCREHVENAVVGENVIDELAEGQITKNGPSAALP